jgi:hypothetical protein
MFVTCYSPGTIRNVNNSNAIKGWQSAEYSISRNAMFLYIKKSYLILENHYLTNNSSYEENKHDIKYLPN